MKTQKTIKNLRVWIINTSWTFYGNKIVLSNYPLNEVDPVLITNAMTKFTFLMEGLQFMAIERSRRILFLFCIKLKNEFGS